MDLPKSSCKKERDDLSRAAHSCITQLDGRTVFGTADGTFDHDVWPMANKILLFPEAKWRRANQHWNIPGDPEKSDPTRSFIEKQLKDGLRWFKNSSVANKLRYFMSIFRNIFKQGKFQELRISWKMVSLKSWKNHQKQEIDFKPLHIMKTMRGMLCFRLGIGFSVESF